MSITHKETLWKILTKTSPQEEVFTTTKSIENGDDLTILQIPHYAGLQPDTDYVVECIHVADNGLKSEPGTITFTPVGSSIQPPIINYPINNSKLEIGNDLVIQASPLISIPAGMTHTATDWRIGTINNPESLQKNESSTNLTSYTVNKTFFSENTKYYLFCRYKSSETYSPWSTGVSFSTSAIQATIQTPVITSPSNGSQLNSIIENIVTSSSFSATGGATHTASMWQISKSSTFDTFVVNQTSSEQKVTYAIAANTLSDTNSVYYIRVKYKGSTAESDWSMPVSITSTATISDPISKPVITSPSAGATIAKEGIMIAASAFVPNHQLAATHTSSQWQIATDSNFSSIAWQTDSTVNKTNVQVPSTSLADGKSYYARVKYKSGSYASEWSSVINFNTTEAAKILPIYMVSPSPNFSLSISNSLNLTASEFNGVGGATFTISSFMIATDSSFNNVVWSTMKSNPASTSATVPANTLTANMTYFIRVGYYSGVGDLREWTPPISISTTEGITEAFINTPNISSPGANSQVDYASTCNLIASSFNSSNGINMTSMQWQISSDSGFTSLIFNQEIPANGNTSYLLPANTLLAGTGYWVRVKYNGKAVNSSGTVSSNWSGVIQFSTNAANYTIATPSFILPANGTTIGQNTPTMLRITAFSATAGVSSLQSVWEIADNINFSGNVSRPTVTSNMDTYTVNLTSIFGTTGKMYVRVKYQGIVNGNNTNIIDSTFSSPAEFNVSTSENYTITGSQNISTSASILLPDTTTNFQATPAPVASSGVNITKAIWSFSDNPNFSGFVEDKEVTSNFSSYDLTLSSAPWGTTGRMYVRVKYVGTVNGDSSKQIESSWSTGASSFYLSILNVKPTITSPAMNASWDPTKVLNLTGTCSNASMTNVRYECSIDSNFTNENNNFFILATCSNGQMSGYINANISFFQNNQTYYIRAKCYAGQINTVWSDVITFKTGAAEEYYIDKPGVTYTYTASSSSFMFVGSALTGTSGLSPSKGTWQFCANENFSSDISQIVRMGADFKTCPLSPISDDSQITRPYVRVQYTATYGSSTVMSPWSDPVRYATGTVAKPISRPSITNIVGTKASGLTITVSPFTTTDTAVSHTTTTISFGSLSYSLSKTSNNTYTLTAAQISGLTAGTTYQSKASYVGVKGSTTYTSDESLSYSFTLTDANTLKPDKPYLTSIMDILHRDEASDASGNTLHRLLSVLPNDPTTYSAYRGTSSEIKFYPSQMKVNGQYSSNTVAQVKVERSSSSTFASIDAQSLSMGPFTFSSSGQTFTQLRSLPGTLANNQTYYYRFAYLPTQTGSLTPTWSDWSDPIKLNVVNYVSKPTFTYPINNNGILLNQVDYVIGSNFVGTITPITNSCSSYWEVSDSILFPLSSTITSGVISQASQGANWTKLQQGPFSSYAAVTKPFVRVRYQATAPNGLVVSSPWSDPLNVTGNGVVNTIAKPSITYPANNGSIGLNTSLTLTASGFSGSNANVVALQSEWLFSNNSDMSNATQITRTVASYGLSGIIQCPLGSITTAQSKYVKVRYIGYSGSLSNTITSEYSDVIHYSVGSVSTFTPEFSSYRTNGTGTYKTLMYNFSVTSSLFNVDTVNQAIFTNTTGKTVTKVTISHNYNTTLSQTTEIVGAATSSSGIQNGTAGLCGFYIPANAFKYYLTSGGHGVMFFKVKFTFSDGTTSNDSVMHQWFLFSDDYKAGSSTITVAMNQPTITSHTSPAVLSGTSNITFSCSALTASTSFNGVSHTALKGINLTSVQTIWWLATGGNTNLISGSVSSNSNSVVVSPTDLNGKSAIFVTYIYMANTVAGQSSGGGLGYFSSTYSAPLTFTVGSLPTFTTPSITSPLSGSTIAPPTSAQLYRLSKYSVSNASVTTIGASLEFSLNSSFSPIAVTKTYTNVESGSSSAGYDMTVSGGTLEAGKTYYVRGRYSGVYNGTTIYSNYSPNISIITPTTTVSITTPTVISIVGTKTSGITITLSPYSASTSACSASIIQITSSPAIVSINKNYSSSNTYTLSAAELANAVNGTTYTFYIKYQGNYNGTVVLSSSATYNFTFTANTVTKPTITTPTANSTSVEQRWNTDLLAYTFNVNASTFTCTGTPTEKKGIYQLSTSSTFSSSITLANNEEVLFNPSLEALALVLYKADKTSFDSSIYHYIRVTHTATYSDGSTASATSDPISFKFSAITASGTLNAPVIVTPTAGAVFNPDTSSVAPSITCSYSGTVTTIQGATIEISTSSSFPVSSATQTAVVTFTNTTPATYASAQTLPNISSQISLTSNTTYYMRIKVHGTSNGVSINSVFSSVRNFITPTAAASASIAAPTVSVTGNKTDGLTISLSTFNGTTTSGTLTPSQAKITFGNTIFTFTHTTNNSYTITSTQLSSFTAGTTYTVSAYYTGTHSTLGTITGSSNSTTHTLLAGGTTYSINTPSISGLSATGTPANKALISVSTFSSPQLTWNGAKSLEIMYANNSSFNNAISVNMTYSSTNSYTMATALDNGTWYFKVRYAATYAAGSPTIYSSYSSYSSLVISAIAINTPTITSPTSGTTGIVYTSAIQLTLSSYSSVSYTQTGIHLQVSTASTFTSNIIDTTFTAINTYVSIPANSLSANTKYYVRARYVGKTSSNVVGYSDWSVSTYTITTGSNVAVITKPSISSVAWNSTPKSWAVLSSAFALTSGTGSHTDTEVQISRGSTFATIDRTIIAGSGATNVNISTATSGFTNTAVHPYSNTTYYVRVRYKSGTVYSDWSNNYTLNTGTTNVGITTPYISSPANNSSYVYVNITSITIQASTFYGYGNINYLKTEIQYSTDSTFATAATINTNTATGANTVMNKTYFTKGTYYFRIRFYGSSNAVSAWSATTKITFT